MHAQRAQPGLRYGIATIRCDKDVAADLRGAIVTPKPKHFAAITKPSEVGALMRALDGYSGHVVTRIAMRLSPHVLLRPGELRSAEWTDIDWEEAIWFIPAERMKMRRPHRVPLSRQVLVMLKELHERTHWWKYLFPCLGRPRKPMSENTVNAGLRRLGYTSKEMTAHGFRAMAATLLNEMGQWNPDAIERQLAHVDTNQVRRAYARGEYWEERVAMMQRWSDYLNQLRDGAAIIRSDFGTARGPAAHQRLEALEWDQRASLDFHGLKIAGFDQFV